MLHVCAFAGDKQETSRSTAELSLSSLHALHFRGRRSTPGGPTLFHPAAYVKPCCSKELGQLDGGLVTREGVALPPFT